MYESKHAPREFPDIPNKGHLMFIRLNTKEDQLYCTWHALSPRFWDVRLLTLKICCTEMSLVTVWCLLHYSTLTPWSSVAFTWGEWLPHHAHQFSFLLYHTIHIFAFVGLCGSRLSVLDDSWRDADSTVKTVCRYRFKFAVKNLSFHNCVCVYYVSMLHSS